MLDYGEQHDAHVRDAAAEDVAMFPELDGYKHVFVWETDSGFVCSEAR